MQSKFNRVVLDLLESRRLLATLLDSTVVVSGRANIYATLLPLAQAAPGGGGAGVIPVTIELPSSNAPTRVTIESTTGTVSGWTAGLPFKDADGHVGSINTNIPAYGGISGVISNGRIMFLSGVFTGVGDNSNQSAPVTPNYSTAQSQADFYPLRRQQVQIGDGRTATGGIQSFHVPSGATKLTLGFAENFQFGSPERLPGFYNDNGGQMTVRVKIDTVAPFAVLANGQIDVGGTSGADTISASITDNVLTLIRNGLSQTFANASTITRIVIQPQAGNDKVELANSVNIPTSINGGDGDDTLRGGIGNDTLTSGAGKNTLYGGSGNDLLNGSGGRDLLYGEGGDDRLYGKGGDDTLDGGGNIDRLWGDDGNDRLIGGSSNDKMYGGNGNDTLFGSAGIDRIVGEGGTDTAHVDDEDDVDTVTTEILL